MKKTTKNKKKLRRINRELGIINIEEPKIINRKTSIDPQLKQALKLAGAKKFLYIEDIKEILNKIKEDYPQYNWEYGSDNWGTPLIIANIEKGKLEVGPDVTNKKWLIVTFRTRRVFYKNFDIPTKELSKLIENLKNEEFIDKCFEVVPGWERSKEIIPCEEWYKAI